MVDPLEKRRRISAERGTFAKEHPELNTFMDASKPFTSDFDKLAKISELMESKRALMADTTTPLEQRAAYINGLQDSIFEIAKTFSKVKDDSQIPTAQQLDDLTIKFKNIPWKVESDMQIRK